MNKLVMIINIEEWIFTNCKFAGAKIHIDLNIVLQKINSGVALSAIAEELGITISVLFRRIKNTYLNPSSQLYNPQINDKIRENASRSRQNKIRLNIDWESIFRLIMEGFDIAAIGRRLNISQQVIYHNLWTRFCNQNSPEFMSELCVQVKINSKNTLSEISKARHADPEFKRQQSESFKARWADPMFRNHAMQWIRSPENIQRLSTQMTTRWTDPEYRERMRELPQVKDFWGWLSTFPIEKQKEIITAINSSSATKQPSVQAFILKNCRFLKTNII